MTLLRKYDAKEAHAKNSYKISHSHPMGDSRTPSQHISVIHMVRKKNEKEKRNRRKASATVQSED